jgi:SAM-dependent methyltransferase
MQSGAYSDPVGFETLEIFSETAAINRWTFEKISGFVEGEILEIGSGIGNISKLLLENFKQVSLSDLRQEYCHSLEEKFGGNPNLKGIYQLDLSLPDFKTRYPHLLEKFDTVIALNVIEHIQDDQYAVENACALLGKRGRLIVLVPAIPGLYNSLDRHLGHYKRYSRRLLINLFAKAGLKVEECRYHNAAAIAGWWLDGSLLKKEKITPVKLRIFNRLVPLFKLVDKLATPMTGISLIISGTKNIN